MRVDVILAALFVFTMMMAGPLWVNLNRDFKDGRSWITEEPPPPQVVAPQPQPQPKLITLGKAQLSWNDGGESLDIIINGRVVASFNEPSSLRVDTIKSMRGSFDTVTDNAATGPPSFTYGLTLPSGSSVSYATDEYFITDDRSFHWKDN